MGYFVIFIVLSKVWPLKRLIAYLLLVSTKEFSLLTKYVLNHWHISHCSNQWKNSAEINLHTSGVSKNFLLQFLTFKGLVGAYLFETKKNHYYKNPKIALFAILEHCVMYLYTMSPPSLSGIANKLQLYRYKLFSIYFVYICNGYGL